MLRRCALHASWRTMKDSVGRRIFCSKSVRTYGGRRRSTVPNNELELTNGDLKMFAAIGVDEDLVTCGGLCRLTCRGAREYGFRFASAANLEGICFPYYNPGSEERVTARLRRDNPEVDTDGKPQNKYILAYGDSRHLYFPPDCRILLSDQPTSVALIESEKSALALTALSRRSGHNLLPVATGGCWSWKGRIGKTTNAEGARVDVKGPLPDLSIIAWKDRDAVICFDSNASTNWQVRSARRELSHLLTAYGAKVRICQIPIEDGVNGPDDYIAKYGGDAFLKLLDASL